MDPLKSKIDVLNYLVDIFWGTIIGHNSIPLRRKIFCAQRNTLFFLQIYSGE